MAVLRDLAVAIKIVENHRFAGKLMTIGRNVFSEQGQIRIAIAFSQVAEDLVKSAILANDVEHVLDLWKDLVGDSFGVCLVYVGFGSRKVSFDLRGVSCKLRL